MRKRIAAFLLLLSVMASAVTMAPSAPPPKNSSRPDGERGFADRPVMMNEDGDIRLYVYRTNLDSDFQCMVEVRGKKHAFPVSSSGYVAAFFLGDTEEWLVTIWTTGSAYSTALFHIAGDNVTLSARVGSKEFPNLLSTQDDWALLFARHDEVETVFLGDDARLISRTDAVALEAYWRKAAVFIGDKQGRNEQS